MNLSKGTNIKLIRNNVNTKKASIDRSVAMGWVRVNKKVSTDFFKIKISLDFFMLPLYIN